MVRSRDAAWPSEARGSGRPGALGSLADTAAGRTSRADAGAWRPAHRASLQSEAGADRGGRPALRVCAALPPATPRARVDTDGRARFFNGFCGNYMRVFLCSDFLFCT